ncbi:MAG TPA: DUF3105 domain-containing protein [Pseudonocardiaceae bacterium]|nr:DUF3105 domain-containing protein [Pseudonocardiaceae bacterium]
MPARSTPWGTIAAVVVVVLFATGVAGYVMLQSQGKKQQEAATAPFAPSAANPDPSRQISGVLVKPYEGRQHVKPTQRVAYDQRPPFGGPHDGIWAACNGVVYPQAVRNENMVHSLEHGAVWVTYNPDQVSPNAVGTLAGKVAGQPYTMLSPYPGLPSAISLQSWGHQLALDNVDDARIDQFLRALQQNPNTHPEVGASCEALGPGLFNQDNPPPFDPGPPGPDAIPMQSPTGPAAPSSAPLPPGQIAPTPTGQR